MTRNVRVVVSQYGAGEWLNLGEGKRLPSEWLECDRRGLYA